MMTGRRSKTESINAATEPEKRRDSSAGKLEYGEKKRAEEREERGPQGPHIRVRSKIQRMLILAQDAKEMDEDGHRVDCLPIPPEGRQHSRGQP